MKKAGWRQRAWRRAGMTTTDLSVQAHTVDGVTYMAVRGELDAATTDAVRTVAQRAVYNSPFTELRIDLAGIASCDTFGLRVLIEIRELCTEHGIELVLERPAPCVLRVIGLAGLDVVFGTDS